MKLQKLLLRMEAVAERLHPVWKHLRKLETVTVRLIVCLSHIAEMLLPPILYAVKLFLLLVFNRYTMSWMAVIGFYAFVYLACYLPHHG